MTPNSIPVESKMEGFILGSKSKMPRLVVFAKVNCTLIFRGVRSSHMYYKAGEREPPESWTGNWRIESLKVHAVTFSRARCLMDLTFHFKMHNT